MDDHPGRAVAVDRRTGQARDLARTEYMALDGQATRRASPARDEAQRRLVVAIACICHDRHGRGIIRRIETRASALGATAAVRLAAHVMIPARPGKPRRRRDAMPVTLMFASLAPAQVPGRLHPASRFAPFWQRHAPILA